MAEIKLGKNKFILSGVEYSKPYKSRYFYNENFIQSNSEESKYFIGLVYTDGSLGKNGTEVSISLHENDKEILETLTQLVAPNKPLYGSGDKKVSRLIFNSRKIYKDLTNLGLYPNKSSTLKPPSNFLIKDRDFWRGCVDGDGWLYLDKRNSLNIGFCGTIPMVEAFRDFCIQYVPDTSKIYIDKKGSNKGNFAKYDFRGERARIIAEILYKDSTFHIKRKYDKYLQHIKNLKPKNFSQFVPVLQYDLDGNFIKKWNSKREVKNLYNLSDLRVCTENNLKSCVNYIWINYLGGEIKNKIQVLNTNRFHRRKKYDSIETENNCI